MIAQPVYLYIADVPVFVIPFGVFPNKRGRHSGLIVPNYGESSYGGRFLKNMGYYWVPSDYFDATFLADFYDDLGFSYKGEINYALRYLLNGTMSGYYLPRDPNTGQNQERWAFQLSHTQIIDPTLRISASGQFQSDRDIERDLSSDVNRRTNQLITSNLTISKSFRGTRTSMSVNANLTQNLKTGEASYTFPDVRFSRPQISLYELFTSGSMNDSRYWYQKINFTYNASMLNRGYKTLQEDSSFMQETKKGLEHNISLNSPQKVLKYFNVTPSINYRELWVNEITQAEYDSSTNTILESQVKQFAIRRIFNTSLAFKTTLYGLLEPNVGSLKFIRHKIDPQISYTYTPDFSTSYWDYFTNVYDSSGKLTQVDKFKKNPFGTTPRANESQSMRISISNLFQAKLIDGDKEKKIDLFTLNFSTGYNFSADSLKWQNLNSSFRSTPLQGISLDVSTSHSFYGVQSTGTNSTRVVDDFLLASGKPLRLLTLQAGTSFSLDNKLFEEEGESSGEEGEEILDSEYQDEGMEDISYIKTEKISDENAAKAVNIPWRVDFNISYAYNRTNVDKPDSRLDLGTRASITLTKNWRINWTGRFDLIEKTIVYQSFSIYRDLHCWEMSLNWQPSNGYYSFQINVKESILQDIKMTKHPAGRAYY
jgi:lipopolysaccharide assembly outer membrane protein LptD (OstA)